MYLKVIFNILRHRIKCMNSLVRGAMGEKSYYDIERVFDGVWP